MPYSFAKSRLLKLENNIKDLSDFLKEAFCHCFHLRTPYSFAKSRLLKFENNIKDFSDFLKEAFCHCFHLRMPYSLAKSRLLKLENNIKDFSDFLKEAFYHWFHLRMNSKNSVCQNSVLHIMMFVRDCRLIDNQRLFLTVITFYHIQFEIANKKLYPKIQFMIFENLQRNKQLLLYADKQNSAVTECVIRSRHCFI